MYMASGFPWVDKTRRRSCHRRNNSGELDLFEAEHDENLGHRGTTLSRKIGLSTREGHGYSTTSRQNWRELGRVSLDMPMIRHTHQHHTISQTQETFLGTINPTKDNKVKKHKPSSPGGKLANFFNSLISQAVSKKKKPSKSSPQSVKDLVEEDSPSGWRRRRRSSISHFRSSTTTTSSFSTAFASRKPNTTPTTRTKRTSMSDIDTKSIESCPSVSGFRTPPPYLISKNTPIKPNKQTNSTSTKNQNCAGNLDWLDEKFKLSSEKQSSSKGLEKRSREFKRFVEEDGAESDSSSDLFELKLNYDHHDQLGYCGGGLPVYESTRMDSIKMSSGVPITNGPFKNS